jgi:hypothetical protein
VLRLVKVFGRVAVRRFVAAAHMSARQTKPEVHPLTSGCQTLLASVRSPWLRRVESDEVITPRSMIGHISLTDLFRMTR